MGGSDGGCCGLLLSSILEIRINVAILCVIRPGATGPVARPGAVGGYTILFGVASVWLSCRVRGRR